MGYVYLLQPSLAIGTNRYKIGCSTKNNTKRIKSYGSNTILLLKYDTNNPEQVETELIKEFKSRFTLYQGKEYFEGNIDTMIECFNNVINKFKNTVSKEAKQVLNMPNSDLRFVVPKSEDRDEQLMLYRAVQHMKYLESIRK